jgi:hypothetical protein
VRNRRSATPPSKGDDLSSRIARLCGLRISQLRDIWRNYFGSPAPRTAKRAFLRRAIAWQMQIDSCGGVTPEIRKSLLRIASDHSRAGLLAVEALVPEIQPGTRLLRSWNGEIHEVIVIPEGFLWKGRTWKSLSRIALGITGTRWSGPIFFGLRRARRIADERRPADQRARKW